MNVVASSSATGGSALGRCCVWFPVAIMAALLLAGCQIHPVPAFARLRQQPAGTELTRQPAGAPMTRVAFTNHLNAEWLQPPAERFTLGPGDKVEIEIVGEPASKTTTIVGPDGKIYFNLLSGVDVWGLTLDQARERLEHELANYVRQPPQLSLTLRGVESKQVWILGRVQIPGIYPLAAPMTLLEAISLAGGTMSLAAFQQQEATGASDELADLQRSFVIRQGKMLPVDFVRLLHQGDLSQNIYLQPDDFVYLATARSRAVYVLGAVAQPRAVPYRQGMTVVAAVASAYGTITGAYMHHVAVVRGSLTDPEIAIVDYRRVLRGEAQDIELQPNDIVYVPFSPYRYLYRYAQLIVNTFVSAAAINAGVRAVGVPNTGQAGVFIPVGSGVQIVPPVAPPPIR